jgi:hypothetical protein
VFEFDVLPPDEGGRIYARYLHYAQVDATCTPPLSISWEMGGQQPLLLENGTFTSTAGGGRIELRGQLAALSQLSLAIKVDGTKADGEFSYVVRFTEGGTDYTCPTGTVTWTATHA